MVRSFHVLISHSCYLLWSIVYSSPLPIFKLSYIFKLSGKGSLYILDSRVLLDIWLSNIFSHCGCLLIVLWSMNIFNFYEVQFISHLRYVLLVLYLRSHCLTQSHEDLFLFCSRGFIALALHLDLWSTRVYILNVVTQQPGSWETGLLGLAGVMWYHSAVVPLLSSSSGWKG